MTDVVGLIEHAALPAQIGPAHSWLGRALTACAACAASLIVPALAPATLAPQAHANSAAADYFMGRASRSAVPKLLSEDERAYYRQVFAAIKASDWTQVQSLLAQKPDGPLQAVARAEYYLAPGSPKIDGDTLSQWLSVGIGLPQAEQIASLAAKRGVAVAPVLPQAQMLVQWPSASRRARPRSVSDGTMPASVSSGINEHIKANDPAGARALLDGIDTMLSPEARSEWRQKIAWAYYINNADDDAYAMAVTAADGAGAWVAEGWWVAGLAAWRIGNCASAADAFAHAAAANTNAELTAASYYWQSRALVRCRQPEAAETPLRAAARADETLYGMLAAEQLGLRLPTTHAAPDFTTADWQALRDAPSVRTAVALAEIGEDGLADEVLRYQARISEPSHYQPLSRLARDLGLPAAQLWMAYNAPAGGSPAPASRYPTPKWSPATGWHVDPALVFAHALQESAFRTAIVSPAGARGLMQVMPAAARDHAAELGVIGNAADLNRPDINLALGQEHLQSLSASSATGGLLPKVMAAYNAGPQPVARWNAQIHDGGDPLLWMESVPYWETRGYVATVFRNYWMYERQAGGASDSRTALAQGLWPTFPGLTGSHGVRVASTLPPRTTTVALATRDGMANGN